VLIGEGCEQALFDLERSRGNLSPTRSWRRPLAGPRSF
jgi:hypothetical protein